jgi:hypothetical protein
MTQKDANEITRMKIGKIQKLAEELKIRIIAKQGLVNNQFIEGIVVFQDTEKYDISTPAPIVREPVEVKIEEPKINEPPNQAPPVGSFAETPRVRPD